MNQTNTRKTNFSTLDISQCSNQEWSANLNSDRNSPSVYSTEMKISRKKYQDVFARELSYNPITQQYTSPEKENKVNQNDSTRMARERDSSFERQVKQETHYNILTMQDKRDPTHQVAKIDPAKQKDLKSQKSGYPYNIINKQAQKGKEAECEKLDEHNVRIPEFRDFNLISNEYVEEHQAKSKKDKEIEKQIADIKYKKDKYQDPIKQEFFKPEDGRIQWDSVQKDNIEKSQRQIKSLPPSQMQSEGQVFDMISKKVKDPERHAKFTEITERKERFKDRYKQENFRSAQNEQDEFKEKMQTFNRKTLNRSIEKFDKGYDIINNRNYDNKEIEYELDAYTFRTKPQISEYYQQGRGSYLGVHDIPATPQDHAATNLNIKMKPNMSSLKKNTVTQHNEIQTPKPSSQKRVDRLKDSQIKTFSNVIDPARMEERSSSPKINNSKFNKQTVDTTDDQIQKFQNKQEKRDQPFKEQSVNHIVHSPKVKNENNEEKQFYNDLQNKSGYESKIHNDVLINKKKEVMKEKQLKYKKENRDLFEPIKLSDKEMKNIILSPNQEMNKILRRDQIEHKKKVLSNSSVSRSKELLMKNIDKIK